MYSLCSHNERQSMQLCFPQVLLRGMKKTLQEFTNISGLLYYDTTDILQAWLPIGIEFHKACEQHYHNTTYKMNNDAHLEKHLRLCLHYLSHTRPISSSLHHTDSACCRQILEVLAASFRSCCSKHLATLPTTDDPRPSLKPTIKQHVTQ